MQGSGGTRTAPPGRPSRRRSGRSCSHLLARGMKATNHRSRSSRRRVSGSSRYALQGSTRLPPSVDISFFLQCIDPASSGVHSARSLELVDIRLSCMLTAGLQAHRQLPHCCDGGRSDLISVVAACIHSSHQGSTSELSCLLELPIMPEQNLLAFPRASTLRMCGQAPDP